MQGTAKSSWSFLEITDYNGDGHADIVYTYTVDHGQGNTRSGLYRYHRWFDFQDRTEHEISEEYIKAFKEPSFTYKSGDFDDGERPEGQIAFAEAQLLFFPT